MSADKYYLGIDGGGSKTSFCVINDKNEIIYYKVSGPSALDTYSLEEISELFKSSVADLNVAVDAIFAGIGGISNKQQQDDVVNILKALKINKENAPIAADNDVINAFFGGLNGEDGIVLIIGTGSVCYGINKKKEKRIGGYSYKEGDPGSAYDLGYKALQYLAKVLDGREAEGPLSLKIQDAIKVYNYEQYVYYINHATRTSIARLAQIVTATSADPQAKAILINGAQEIILMVDTILKQLNFENETNYTIIGSLGKAETFYRHYLLKELTARHPKLHYVEPLMDAGVGSAIKARSLTICKK